MSGLDSKKLFDIFDKYPIDGVEENLNSYKNSFRFKIEMFVKIVIYGDQWKKQVISLFTKSTIGMDIEDINNAGEFMLYTRAWFWISQFDFDDEDCVKALNKLDHSSLLASIIRTIKYFEKTEEFEKCSFLVNIKKLLK